MKVLLITLFLIIGIRVLVYVFDLRKDDFPKVQEIRKGVTKFLLVIDILLLIWIGYYIFYS